MKKALGIVSFTLAGMLFAAGATAAGLGASPRWIGPVQGDKWSAANPAPCFIKSFTLDKCPASALAKIASAGWFELRVNGKKAGNYVLEPVTCQPDKRMLEVTHEIAPLLRKGENEIEVLVGNGWFGTGIPKDAWGFHSANWHQGIPSALRAAFVFDGKTAFVTDETWKVYDSPIVFTALRCGEQYDARLEGTRRGLREAVVLKKVPSAMIVPDDADSCRVTSVFEPKASFAAKDGGTIYDFRHNIAGWCEIEVEGESGATVTIDYDEIVNPDKSFYGHVRIFCDDKMPYGRHHDVYTLSGKGTERWHPRFVYHGFRYARVRINGKATLKAIRAVEVSSYDIPIGHIKTSDANFSALQAAMQRSFKANFVGIPTDCPHREQNGWTGDAQLACETGLWNYDAKKGYEHFIRMMIDAQNEKGVLSCILPRTEKFGLGWGTGPAWDAALFEIPKRIFLFYGDDTLAKEAYGAMKKYLAYSRTRVDKDGLFRYGLGDWCALKNSNVADNRLTDSAYVWYMHRELAFWADRFGEPELAGDMLAKAAEIKERFNKAFYKGDGVYDRICKDDSDLKRPRIPLTSLAAPIYFKGLCADGEEKKVAERLVAEVRYGGWKCWFGILGSKWVPPVLAEYGYQNDAWKLFTLDTGSGYMNFLKDGYDSLWENFEGNISRNHIMFGDFSAWGYEYIAGIVQLEPGFRKIALKPHFIDGVESFEVSHKTKYGVIRAGWKRDKSGKPIYTYDVPKGIEVVK